MKWGGIIFLAFLAEFAVRVARSQNRWRYILEVVWSLIVDVG